MKKRGISIWVMMVSCILIVVLLSFFSNLIAQTEYQDFYHGFSERYSRIMELLSVKNDVKEMYTAAASYTAYSQNTWSGIEKDYEEAYSRAKETLTKLKSELEDEEYYCIVDILNMLLTFDENYRMYYQEVKHEYSLYLQTDLRYLSRLEGYIADEITTTNELLSISAKDAYDDFMVQLEGIRRTGTLMVAAATAVSMLIAMWMVRSIAHPVQRLVERMHRFAEHQEESIQTDKQPIIREIAELVDSYSLLTAETMEKRRMERELDRQQLENAETRELLKSAELDMLRMQMDPHFLFNTLNCISALGEVENAPRVSEMVQHLSEMLRYSMNSRTQFAPLREELAIVQDYVSILRMRFGSKLEYHEEADVSCQECMVPCMIVQPLVENSVQHGFPRIKAGDQIQVVCNIADGCLVIRVQDNGQGITPERLSEITNRIRNDNEEQKGGIGLTNVLARMNLLYGKGHVLIESTPNVGTCIVLRIPMIEM